jgi:hypothetical protein
LKKAIPSLESEFDDLGDVLLQFLRASVQNIQPECNNSDAHTRIGNTFLAIGVIALNVENMSSFRPSIEHFVDVCASVLNTEGLSSPFIHVCFNFSFNFYPFCIFVIAFLSRILCAALGHHVRRATIASVSRRGRAKTSSAHSLHHFCSKKIHADSIGMFQNFLIFV